MFSTRFTRLAGLSLALATLALACAEQGAEREASGPRVEGVSTSSLVVGQTLFLYGQDLLSPDQGENTLHFVGEFHTDDGQVEPVNLSVPAVYDGLENDDNPDALQVLKVHRFGPFANPFSERDRPGVFQGTVSVMTTSVEGDPLEEGDPGDLTIEVGPSLIIEEFQPLDAECGAPALRALAGLPYRLRVKPVGLAASRFIYEISAINGQDDQTVVRFEHNYGAPVADDSLGLPLDEGGQEGEYMVFNPVGVEEQFYVSVIRVFAFDTEGNSVETALPVTVHRPLEVVYTGKRELAERYEPQPVSACTPGSIRNTVDYSETTSETRQETVNVAFTSSFLSSAGVSTTMGWKEGIAEGEQVTRTVAGTDREREQMEERYGLDYGNSQRNEVGYSSSDGESWEASTNEGRSEQEYRDYMAGVYGSVSGSVAVGAKVEGSVPGFAKASANSRTTVGARAGGRYNDRTGARVGSSSNQGFSVGGDRSERTSFGSATTDSRGRSLAGTYALTSERDRSYSDTMSRQNTRTWSFGEGVRVSEVVSQGNSETEQRTWVSSSTESTTQAYSGFIPQGRAGIFYRQTTRWVRVARVRGFDLCGLATDLGELHFNEWTWAPDLAIGDTCQGQPPESNLPPAHCFIKPCGG